MRTCLACSRQERAPCCFTQHGPRLLCQDCAARYALLPRCDDFAHDYRGHAAGSWLCVRCGYELASTPIAP